MLLKSFLFAALAFFASSASAQDKYSYIRYNKLIELKGTDFVLATYANFGKMTINSSHLLFINTANGETRQVDFPRDGYIEEVE